MPRRTIPGSGKKVPLNMRTTAELRAKIEKACGVSGRSRVQEVEYRVEQSFHEGEMSAAMVKLFEYIGKRLDNIDYQSDRNGDLLQAIAKALTDWPMNRNDKTVFDRALRACEVAHGDA